MLKRSLLAVLLVTLLLVAPIPVATFKMRWPALIGELENATHIVLFAGLAWTLLLVLKQYLPTLGFLAYPASFVLVVGFGLGMEIIQAMVGRDSAWIDLANDAAGALIALLMFGWWERRRRQPTHGITRLLPLAAGMVLAVAVTPLCWTLAAYAYRVLESPVVWRADDLLMQRFSKWYPWQPPVFELNEVPLNGNSDPVVEVDIRNLTDQPLLLRVRVRGARHPYRHALLVRKAITLAPAETRTLAFSRSELLSSGHRGDIDLTAAGQLTIIQDAAVRTRLFRVEEVRRSVSNEP